MRQYTFFVIALAAAIASTPTTATTWVEQKFTCPVGGEKFTARVVASNITFGQRPDAKPYSPLPIYPIVECPKNGLLLYKDEFTDAEVIRLGELVGSEKYQSMRNSETSYFRAHWLMKEMGEDPFSLAGHLLTATWQADGDWDRKVRYNAAFIAAATGLERTDEDAESWFWLNLRAANALREMGYYEESLSLLARLDREEFLPKGEDALAGARMLLDGLSDLSRENNPTREPANLVPPDIAAFRCVVPRDPLSRSEQDACAEPQVEESIASISAKDDDGKRLTGRDAIRYLDSKRQTAID